MQTHWGEELPEKKKKIALSSLLFVKFVSYGLSAAFALELQEFQKAALCF